MNPRVPQRTCPSPASEPTELEVDAYFVSLYELRGLTVYHSVMSEFGCAVYFT